MSAYTYEQLNDMDHSELALAYETIMNKTLPSKLKKKDAINEILNAQQEEEELEETESEKKVRTAPASKVRSTLLKTKSPPAQSKILSAQVSRSYTVEPQAVSTMLVEKEIEEEEESLKPKRGRPPKKVEKLVLTSSEEPAQQYQPPPSRKPEKVENILDKIKKSAKVSLLNPKASFQSGDTVREKEPETITPIVVAEANLVSVKLPVHEEAIQSITDFLHEVGYTGEKEVVAPEEEEVYQEEEVQPSSVSKVVSVEPKSSDFLDIDLQEERFVPKGKEESRRKSVKDIIEESKQSRMEEELRYAKEQEAIQEKEKELEKRFLQAEESEKKISRMRRPVVTKTVTAEGEMQEEQIPEPSTPVKEKERKEVFSPETERLLSMPLIRKTKTTVPVVAPPPPLSKKSARKEKVEEIVTEIEEPVPLVVKKSIQKSVAKETEEGPKDVVEVEEEELIKLPKKVPSKPSSKKKAAVEEVPEEAPSSRPSSKKPSSKKKKDEPTSENVIAVLKEIDAAKLGTGDERGKNFYNLAELKDFLSKLGLRVGGSKKELVDRIKEVMANYEL
jgi:hypothetical protein